MAADQYDKVIHWGPTCMQLGEEPGQQKRWIQERGEGVPQLLSPS